MRLDEVDLYDADNFVDGVPHEMLATLRREAPVYWHPHPSEDGFWCITRHADLIHVNRDSDIFSSYEGLVFVDTPPPDQLAVMRMMMLNMDPPEHTKLRKIVNRGFTPKRIRELEDILRDRARHVVDEVIEKGECEFVSDLACELPLQAIAEFLGVPQEDRRKLFDWSNMMIGSNDPEMSSPEAANEAGAQIYAYASGLAQERVANPRDDIVTALITAEVDGEALTTTEFELFFLLLAVAGNETTRNAISHGMLALIENPVERKRLLDDPSLIDMAVEEILRWASPVMNFRRTATRDTELHGQTIKAGDKVLMWHISANRDEEVFDDAFRFDVGREYNPHTLQHVAFGGGGPHFCLGANLARAEIKVMFEELLARVPDMELAGPVKRMRSNFINGIKEMPVSFKPGARS